MFHENTEGLELIFKDALATYGIPKAFYCDNGPLYISHHLQIVCARLEHHRQSFPARLREVFKK